MYQKEQKRNWLEGLVLANEQEQLATKGGEAQNFHMENNNFVHIPNFEEFALIGFYNISQQISKDATLTRMQENRLITPGKIYNLLSEVFHNYENIPLRQEYFTGVKNKKAIKSYDSPAIVLALDEEKPIQLNYNRLIKQVSAEALICDLNTKKTKNKTFTINNYVGRVPNDRM